jgi:hypothetical protein
MELFCGQAGYEARFVPSGFLPSSPEERLLIAPPERNMDLSHWKDDPGRRGPSREEGGADQAETAELEAFRRRLEGLL